MTRTHSLPDIAIAPLSRSTLTEPSQPLRAAATLPCRYSSTNPPRYLSVSKSSRAPFKSMKRNYPDAKPFITFPEAVPEPKNRKSQMTRPKRRPTRRSRRRNNGQPSNANHPHFPNYNNKRPFEGREKNPKRMRRNYTTGMDLKWTECNAGEVSQLHRNCMKKGQPLAPYNTTQFIMNEHNAEKEIDFDELSGQIQQMHNSRRCPFDGSGGCGDSSGAAGLGNGRCEAFGAARSDVEESNRDEYYYSSPEDESFFLEQQFHEAYNTMHAERLNSMSKSDLLKEYLLIEKELESLRQKSSPSSSTAGGAATSATTAPGSTGDGAISSSNNHHHHPISLPSTKSPRPPSMPSSPRGQHLNSRLPHHPCNGNACSHHRSLFKENKQLRKLLKQVYSRYNSLLYCINYVNNNNNSSSSNSSELGGGSAETMTGFFDEGAGVSSSTNGHANVTTTSSSSGQTPHPITTHQATTTNSQSHQPPPAPSIDDFQMSNEMHYRIEKYICHPSASPLSSSTTTHSSSSSSSTSYTSSSSSSTSTSTSITSEDDVLELGGDAGRPGSGPEPATSTAARTIDSSRCELHYEDGARQPMVAAVRGLLEELVDLVVEGN